MDPFGLVRLTSITTTRLEKSSANGLWMTGLLLSDCG